MLRHAFLGNDLLEGFSRGEVEVAGCLVGGHPLLAVHHMELPGRIAGWAPRWTMLRGKHPLLPHCCHRLRTTSRRRLRFPVVCREKGSEPPRTRTWNLEIKSLRSGVSGLSDVPAVSDVSGLGKPDPRSREYQRNRRVGVKTGVTRANECRK
jgi:hypothetical protein